MPFSTYCIQIDHPDDPDQVVLFSTRTAATVTLHRDVVQDIVRGALSSEEQGTLCDLGMLVPDLENERKEMLAYVEELNVASKTLTITLVMNLNCNLDCAYCFEGTRKGNYFLSEETAADFLRFIHKRIAGLDEIKITFYGGEPLLSFDRIASISREMTALANAAKVTFSFGLVTNGTLLTRRVVEQLKPLGLQSAYVTLDGPAEIHDGSRPFKNGTASFDTIIRNLQSVSGLIEIRLGGNYTRANYPAFPGLLDTLTNVGLGPDRISLLSFSPVTNEDSQFSPDFHAGCTNMNEPWIAEAGIALRREILAHGFRTDEVLPAVCMVERHDHLVINWDGDLYKCTGLIGRTEFCAGTLKAGMLDHAALHDLGNWKNEECLCCTYLPLCFGGCRYLKLLREGALQGIDCKKEYFDRALKKLVLQDIKYNQAPES
jgi:uncharacterized protein